MMPFSFLLIIVEQNLRFLVVILSSLHQVANNPQVLQLASYIEHLLIDYEGEWRGVQGRKRGTGYFYLIIVPLMTFIFKID